MEKKYVRINDVIEFLPENSTERAILEYKYIDNYSWNKICNLEHMSRTPATQYWRKGLYKLLEFAKVQEIVREYRKSEAVQLYKEAGIMWKSIDGLKYVENLANLHDVFFVD